MKKSIQGEMENHLNHPPLFLETMPFIFQGVMNRRSASHLRPSLETTPGFQRRVELLGGDFGECPSHDWCPSKTGIPTKKNTGGNLRHSPATISYLIFQNLGQKRSLRSLWMNQFLGVSEVHRGGNSGDPCRVFGGPKNEPTKSFRSANTQTLRWNF